MRRTFATQPRIAVETPGIHLNGRSMCASLVCVFCYGFVLRGRIHSGFTIITIIIITAMSVLLRTNITLSAIFVVNRRRVATESSLFDVNCFIPFPSSHHRANNNRPDRLYTFEHESAKSGRSRVRTVSSISLDDHHHHHDAR